VYFLYCPVNWVQVKFETARQEERSRRDFLRVAAASTLTTASAAAQAGPRPNIVVIVADDLGFADVSFNGCQDYETPNLDALAVSGVRFSNGYVTHPYCSPSRAAILTGRYQQRFGHEANPPFAPDDDTIGTATDEVLLTDVLRAAGYRTAAIGKWHLGDAPRFLPSRRGFDEFFGFSSGGYNYYGMPNRRDPRHRVVRNGAPVAPSNITYLTDDFSDEAVAFIKRNRQRPFFLYLAYNAVHAPNQAPQRYLDRTQYIEYGVRSVYAAMAVAMDDGIGKVMAALSETGARENTLVFFLSDNGGRTDGADNRPLRGHKGLLYDGGTHVPFLVSWPRRLVPSAVYRQPVSSLDIFPTAMGAAQAGPSKGKPLDGVDLVPFLTGGSRYAPHETLYWRVLGGQGWAVRHGGYKLVKRAATDRIQLFDLDADMGERRDLAAQKPQVVAELRQLYERWNAQLVPPRWTDPHAQNVRKEYQDVMSVRQRALPPASK
jgi:arylsulfatase A-like enzyme